MTLNKYLRFALSTALILSVVACTTPTTTPSNSTDSKPKTVVDNKTNSTTTEKKDEKLLTLDRFTLKVDDSSGAKNPITPEDIDYLELNGTKVLAKDIVLVQAKADLSKGLVRFIGSGNYVFNPTTNNKDILNVKFKKSDKVSTIPLLKKGFSIKDDDNEQIIYSVEGVETAYFLYGAYVVFSPTLNQASYYGYGIAASMDFTKNEFTFGNANSPKKYNLDDFVSSNNPTGTEVTADTKKQLEDIKTQSQNTKKNPFDPYVGVWKLNYLDSNFICTIRKLGTNDFVITSIINNKTFSSKGNYNTTSEKLEFVDFKSSFNNESFSARINMVNDNNLKLTLLSSDSNDLKTFLNLPFSLTRKTD
ncbi:MAG: hypothetical protein U0354_04625 [Candidatus Sericytochromatia bacterium]